MKQLDKLTGQMARWIDYLEGFHFEVKTRPGKEHDNADFLFRLYTDCFCKHRENFSATATTKEALRDEPVKDWDLFERVCLEQADRRILGKRSEILHILDEDALTTLSDRDLEEQRSVAAKLSTAQDAQVQVERVKSVMLRRHTPVVSVRCARVVRSDRAKTPKWTCDQLRISQAEDDDLRVLYAAKNKGEATSPEWKDITFESLGCKYYHREWIRLRLINDLLYRLCGCGDHLVPIGGSARVPAVDTVGGAQDHRGESSRISPHLGVSTPAISLV